MPLAGANVDTYPSSVLERFSSVVAQSRCGSNEEVTLRCLSRHKCRGRTGCAMQLFARRALLLQNCSAMEVDVLERSWWSSEMRLCKRARPMTLRNLKVRARVADVHVTVVTEASPRGSESPVGSSPTDEPWSIGVRPHKRSLEHHDNLPSGTGLLQRSEVQLGRLDPAIWQHAQ